MSDVQISDGLGGTATVGTRTMADGSEVQEFLLVRSDTTTTTYSTVDANGVLVNLGSNNDVSVSGGTVNVGGTPTVTFGGTPAVSVSGGTVASNATLQAGTDLVGYVGLSADGTAIMDMLSLANGTAALFGLANTQGDQVAFEDPVIYAFTIANGTAAYADGDTMGTANTHSAASRGAGYTGHITSAVCTDPAAQGGTVYLHVFDSAVTPSADNAAYTLLGGSDLGKAQGVITFSDWYSAGTAGYIGIGKLTPAGHPIHYATSGGSALTSVAVSGGTGTYGGTALSFELHAVLD